MTLLGKVFTAIVLVLSVVFFVLALMVNATHINYRDQVENPNTGLRAQVDKSKRQEQDLRKALEEAKAEVALEQASRRAALAALQTQLESIRNDLASKEATLSNLQSQLTTLTATEQLTQKELSDRTKENEQLRQQLVSARDDRNNQYQSYVKTLDEYLRLQGDLNTLKRASADIARNYNAAKEKLNILGIAENTKLDGPPAVNGEITSISNNLVEVSVGKDDGIRIGHTLDVYRGGQYLGRLKVTRSEDDRAIAEVLPSYQKGMMRAGDRVDSRLSEMYVARPAAQ
jgi:predicted  nucleic acid-binding Zn-ribbon protein